MRNYGGPRSRNAASVLSSRGTIRVFRRTEQDMDHVSKDVHFPFHRNAQTSRARALWVVQRTARRAAHTVRSSQSEPSGRKNANPSRTTDGGSRDPQTS